MKNLCLCVIAGILLLSYRDLCTYMDKQEQRKQRLNEYYTRELSTLSELILDKDLRDLHQGFWEDREATQNHMAQDGYDWATIKDMTSAADLQARETLSAKSSKQ